ncbi:hypothetical protein HY572_05510 [Candidatus Micrarchaeota archaeon]|nr:hypothetical protein [Candidatus Micrarchaeota archaeon]
MVIEALKEKQWIYHRFQNMMTEIQDQIHFVSDPELPGHMIPVLVRKKTAWN